MTGAITIRSSTESDVPAIRDLALLDGGGAPVGDALLAFVDGELRVAVGRADGAAVADPFHLTADVVELVRARAARAPAGPACTAGSPAHACDPRGGEGMNRNRLLGQCSRRGGTARARRASPRGRRIGGAEPSRPTARRAV